MHIIILLLSLLIPINAYSNSNSIEYDLKPIIDSKNGSYLQVKVSFKGNKTGKTNLVLPYKWAGIDDYHNYIKIVDVIDAKVKATITPNVREIIHQPDQYLSITYNVIQAFKGHPQDLKYAYYPIMNDSYFHIIGCSVFAYPDWYNQSNITLRWNAPNNWLLANSFNNQEKLEDLSINALMSSIHLIGDFKRVTRTVKGNRVDIIIRDKWLFDDNEYADKIAKIIASERDFFNDNSQKYFLVSTIQIGEGDHSANGTGLTDSFALFLPNAIKLNENLLYLFSHEYFHNWNTSNNFVDKGEAEENYYWFTEGITDYYANLFNLRNGLIDLETYIELYNYILFMYYTSPVKTEPQTRIAKDFWNNYDVEKLPYQRGNILAHNFNAKIKRKSNNKYNFDDYIKLLIDPKLKGKKYLSTSKIIEVSKQFIPDGIGNDYQQFIVKGNLIPIDPNSLGPCVKLNMVRTARKQFGFDIKKSKQLGLISDMQENSNAYKAGLRNGQRLIKIIKSEKITEPLKVTVEIAGKLKVIEYLAYIGSVTDVPQFKLDDVQYKHNPHQCYQWFK